MGESQSRYSIVERLTTKKLEIMNSKSRLNETVTQKEQSVGKLKKQLQNYLVDVKEDVKREQRRQELEIERAEQEYENSKTQLAKKENVFDEQIEAIEEALKSIEEISKTAPSS